MPRQGRIPGCSHPGRLSGRPRGAGGCPGALWGTLAVAAGGAVGTLARYGISAAFPQAAGSLDWATLAISVPGAP